MPRDPTPPRHRTASISLGPLPVRAQRQHVVAAIVAQGLHHGAGGVERGEAGDVALDGGAADLEAVLNLDAGADGAATAGDSIEHELDAMGANEAGDGGVAFADAADLLGA